MGTPANTRHTQIYAAAQAALGTGIVIAETDALTQVVEFDATQDGSGPIQRMNLNALGGGAETVQGSRFWSGTAKTELTAPVTSGDASTWQHGILWASGPQKITDNGATLTVGPELGNVAMTDYVPVTLEWQTLDGLKGRATDVRFVFRNLTAIGGERVMVEWEWIGAWEKPVDAALAAAPAPANGGLPMLARGVTWADGITTTDLFSLSMTSGLTLAAREDTTTTYGYAVAIGGNSDVAQLSTTVLWDDAYPTAIDGETDLTPVISIGTGDEAVSIVLGLRYVTGTPGDAEGAQTLDLVGDIVTDTSTHWSITIGT